MVCLCQVSLLTALQYPPSTMHIPRDIKRNRRIKRISSSHALAWKGHKEDRNNESNRKVNPEGNNGLLDRLSSSSANNSVIYT
ncbi:hypothetical protein BJX99DRAFT_237979 [Aspergillus californicus]